MRGSWLGAALLVAGVVPAALIATDAVPALRGPESWRWARRPLEAGPALLVPIAVFVLHAAVALAARARWARARDLVRAPLLGLAMLAVLAQMVALTAIEPGGLANLPRRVLDPAFASYHTVARDVTDVRAFLAEYPRLQKDFPVHGPSQPPGRVLFFRQVNEWASASPERTAAIVAAGERLGGIPPGPPGTTDGQRAGAFVAAGLLLAAGALALVPLVVLLGGRCDPGAVGTGVLLAGAWPSYLLFTPQTDHLLLLLTLSSAALLAEAMRYASRPFAPALALGAGLAAGAAIFVSFTALAALGAWALALAGLVAFGARRRTPMPAGRHVVALAAGGVLGLAIPLGAAAAAGLDWVATFREATAAAHRVQVLVHGRTWGEWIGWNLWDFALFLGPPVVVLALVRAAQEIRAWRAGGARPGLPPIEIPFGLALVVSVLALDLSGRILGETGRIWMFLMPLGIGAAAAATGSWRPGSVVPLALGQLLVLAALRGFLNVPG